MIIWNYDDPVPAPLYNTSPCLLNEHDVSFHKLQTYPSHNYMHMDRALDSEFRGNVRFRLTAACREILHCHKI